MEMFFIVSGMKRRCIYANEKKNARNMLCYIMQSCCIIFVSILSIREKERGGEARGRRGGGEGGG